jgi:hypothetical protein
MLDRRFRAIAPKKLLKPAELKTATKKSPKKKKKTR